MTTVSTLRTFPHYRGSQPVRFIQKYYNLLPLVETSHILESWLWREGRLSVCAFQTPTKVIDTSR